MFSKRPEPRSIASQLILLFTLAAALLLACGLGVFYWVVVRHAFAEDNAVLADKVDTLQTNFEQRGGLAAVAAEIAEVRACRDKVSALSPASLSSDNQLDREQLLHSLDPQRAQPEIDRYVSWIERDGTFWEVIDDETGLRYSSTFLTRSDESMLWSAIFLDLLEHPASERRLGMPHVGLQRLERDGKRSDLVRRALACPGGVLALRVPQQVLRQPMPLLELAILRCNLCLFLEARELAGNLELLRGREARAGRLLAVAQGRVEDCEPVVSHGKGPPYVVTFRRDRCPIYTYLG